MIETHSLTKATLGAAMPTAIAIAMAVPGSLATPTTAAAATAERCGRAVVAASNKILRAETRALSHCALAVVEQDSAGATEDTCSRLRTPGLRIDKLDAHSRGRIERRCSDGAPAWMPPLCQGPGPATGDPQLDSVAIARCAITSAHCAALATLDMVFDDPLSALEAQHPDNLHYGLGGVEGNTFASCVGSIDSPTTTLGAPTTTLTAPTTTLPSTGAPQLVITEIMSNPSAQSDAAGEYFEVLNAGSGTVDLDGLIIADLGSDSFTVNGSLAVAAGQRAVFGKSETAAGGVIDYVYGSGMSLTNSSDEIVLMVGTDVIDQVVYDGSFPSATGRAIELVGAQSATGNEDPAAWCVSDSALADGDFGTPGAAVGPCLP